MMRFPIALVVCSAVMWIDLLGNNGNLLVGLCGHQMFVPFLGTAFFVFLFFQMSSLDIYSEFTYLMITVLCIPLIVAAYAYAYHGDQSGGVNECATSVECTYFSIVTFTTLGYGDVQPYGHERIYAASQALLGFIFIPLLISQLINMVRDFKTANGGSGLE